MRRPEILERLKKALREHLPEPVKAQRKRLRALRHAAAEKLVGAFFPTNSSGNNISRG